MKFTYKLTASTTIEKNIPKNLQKHYGATKHQHQKKQQYNNESSKTYYR